MSLATVVTAYYPIPSKFPSEKYVNWIRQFWPQTSCPLVFYTDPGLVNSIESMLAPRRAPWKVVGLPFQELTAFQALSPLVWLTTHQTDPEKGIHSPELYAIWFEKKEFVARTIRENPFGTETFVWCDAGIGRYPAWIPSISQRFALEERIPKGKMLLLQVQPFQEGDERIDPTSGIRGEFTGRNTVGGGILASDRAGWSAWSAAYDTMLMKYYLNGRFIGKDQNIMGSVVLEHPELVEIVDPPSFMQPVERWFYLLFYLAAVDVV